MSFFPWVVGAALVVLVVRQLPRLLRDLRAGPLPDVGTAADDAEPMALVLPNDDGMFTWSVRLPDEPPDDVTR
jgi:hypothetical protein